MCHAGLEPFEPTFRRPANRRTSPQRKAFTLVELLVAIVVLSILTLLLCGILNQVSTTWTQIRAQIDWRQNGRTILNVIASELRVATLSPNRADPYGLQLMVDPKTLLGNTTYLNPHALFWQAPIASDTSAGNMAEVGYFVRWDTTVATNPRAMLCRFFVNPSDTAHYFIYSNPTAWLTTGASGTLDTIAPGTAAQNYKGWFADNVIGLWVRCLDANGMPITRTAADTGHLTDSKTTNYSFDSRLGYLASNAGGASPAYIAKSAYYDPVAATEMVAGALPSTIEIAIVLVDSQTANRITKIPDYTPYNVNPANAATAPYTQNSPVDFWNDINFFLANLKSGPNAQPLVAKGAHVYSIRVPLVSGG